MRGTIPPFPNTPSWRGAQFKKPQGRIYLYFTHIYIHTHTYTYTYTYICEEKYAFVILSTVTLFYWYLSHRVVFTFITKLN